jgi:hypothetical protein
MDTKRFQELKSELETDAKTIAKALIDFSTKWKAREEEIKSMTPAQNDEMERAAAWLDEALDALP